MAAERRYPQSGKKVSDVDNTVSWVFTELIPQLEAEEKAEQAAADVRDGVVIRLVPEPRPPVPEGL